MCVLNPRNAFWAPYLTRWQICSRLSSRVLPDASWYLRWSQGSVADELELHPLPQYPIPLPLSCLGPALSHPQPSFWALEDIRSAGGWRGGQKVEPSCAWPAPC